MLDKAFKNFRSSVEVKLKIGLVVESCKLLLIVPE